MSRKEFLRRLKAHEKAVALKVEALGLERKVRRARLASKQIKKLAEAQ
jgi:hypothetical protein